MTTAATSTFLREAGQKIADIGAAFQVDPDTAKAGAAIGLDFYGFYGLGRGGVMGDADPRSVAAAKFFIEPGLVRAVWEASRAIADPRAAAASWSRALGAFGRRRLAAVDCIEALAEVARRVIDAADPGGLPLFAGWKSAPVDDDAPAAAMQRLYALREFRGGCHAIAVRVAGVPTATAILTTHGEALARLFGWQDALDGRTPDPQAMERVEALTDELVAPAFSVLSEADRRSFASVLDACHSAAGGRVDADAATRAVDALQRGT